ncbi:MAG: flavin reductase family protein [Deltaproteobacteria bacterium]|nr:flavin reductase family protein [Deltaproteobacteria bacterium]
MSHPKQRHLYSKDLSQPEVSGLLNGGVGPRPIALVSTVNTKGQNNLAPFSFFNAFGTHPPMVAFSPSRRGRDGTFKDTYHNLMETKECVIQVVTYDMVEQVNLTSMEYPAGVDEFKKSGLTPIDSTLVKPKRVQESPYQMECKLFQIIPLGNGKGSGNLAICEVLLFHIDERILKENQVHSEWMDLVGRNGANFYTRASQTAMFEVPRILQPKGIGFDQLPDFVKNDPHLTKNQMARLTLIDKIPSEIDIRDWAKTFAPLKDPTFSAAVYKAIQNALEKMDLALAWKLLIWNQNPKKYY